MIWRVAMCGSLSSPWGRSAELVAYCSTWRRLVALMTSIKYKITWKHETKTKNSVTGLSSMLRQGSCVVIMYFLSCSINACTKWITKYYFLRGKKKKEEGNSTEYSPFSPQWEQKYLFLTSQVFPSQAAKEGRNPACCYKVSKYSALPRQYDGAYAHHRALEHKQGVHSHCSCNILVKCHPSISRNSFLINLKIKFKTVLMQFVCSR